MRATRPTQADIRRHARTVLENAEPPVLRAILYGSVARGMATPESDVDILVVSPAFEAVDVSHRGRPFRDVWDYDRYGSLHLICYTEEEYRANRTTAEMLVRTAEREGRFLIDRWREGPLGPM